MNMAEVKCKAFAIPPANPASTPGPYRFVNPEFLIVTYRTDLDEAPIAGGRELWRFPKKRAAPSRTVERDTRLGTLDYGPVRCLLEDLTVKAAWTGPATPELAHQAPAPVAALPVLEVISGTNTLTDTTLGLGSVAFDDLV